MMLAFGPLRLAPQNFWCSSPREMQAALDGHFGDAAGQAGHLMPLNSRELGALRAQFPD